MAVRKAETFPPVTMGHVRGHGCRNLLIYCGSLNCNHSATMNADWLSDDVPVVHCAAAWSAPNAE